MSRNLVKIDEVLLMSAKGVPKLLQTWDKTKEGLSENQERLVQDLDVVIEMYDEWMRNLSPGRKVEVTRAMVQKQAGRGHMKVGNVMGVSAHWDIGRAGEAARRR